MSLPRGSRAFGRADPSSARRRRSRLGSFGPFGRRARSARVTERLVRAFEVREVRGARAFEVREVRGARNGVDGCLLPGCDCGDVYCRRSRQEPLWRSRLYAMRSASACVPGLTPARHYAVRAGRLTSPAGALRRDLLRGRSVRVGPWPLPHGQSVTSEAMPFLASLA